MECSLAILNKKIRSAKSTAHPLCLVGVLYKISQEKICWWLINHFYAIGHKSYWIRRKPICDFLLVINANLPPILHCFQVITDYMSNFC